MHTPSKYTLNETALKYFFVFTPFLNPFLNLNLKQYLIFNLMGKTESPILRRLL